MTTYYVGSGGNDGNAGTSWAARKLTVNGAEDIPVVAGDTVIVGPGVYREQLVCDVSGSAGNPITYVGDPTGGLTDGIGGIVRITGSDNDQTMTRAYGVNVGARDYRTFQGFQVDSCSQRAFEFAGGSNVSIVDCAVLHCVRMAYLYNAETNLTIQRCFIGFLRNEALLLNDSLANASHLIENTVFLNAWYRQINNTGVGGITVRNCFLSGGQRGIEVNGLPGGYTAVTVNNSIVINHDVFGLRAGTAGMLVEDYNAVVENATDLSNVAAGANSLAVLPQLAAPRLIAGFEYSWWFGKLSSWSALGSVAGTSVPSDDLFGITRAGSPSSWGPIEYTDSPARRDWDAGTSRGRRGL